ncbi:MAG: hypothetical protein L6R48_13250, partial [Planctomycetes bacterium]|nr:hypothetical protein [Planctomycetota bacterium]
GPGFRGLAVFRLPAPGDLPAFAPLRLARALSGAAPAPARLAATLERQAEGWALLLANPGDEDLAEPAAAALAGGGPAPDWTPPGGLAVEPAVQGRPCSPARADGCRIALRFLRAGARLAIPLQGAAPTLLPCD